MKDFSPSLGMEGNYRCFSWKNTYF